MAALLYFASYFSTTFMKFGPIFWFATLFPTTRQSTNQAPTIFCLPYSKQTSRRARALGVGFAFLQPD